MGRKVNKYEKKRKGEDNQKKKEIKKDKKLFDKNALSKWIKRLSLKYFNFRFHEIKR